MFRRVFGMAGIAALIASPTLAADPVDYEPAPMAAAPAAVYDWSGIYVGGLVGYGSGDSEHCDADTTPPCQPGFPRFDIDGVTGGVTVGYNHQINNWVLGIEGDYSFGDIEGSSLSTAAFGCGLLATDVCATEIESYGTIRGRAGYAFGRVLPYLTAGVAITHLSASIGSGAVGASDSTTEASFTAGGGVEVGFTQRLSAKLEYLYIDDAGDFAYDTVGACGTPGCFTRDNSFHAVRLGVNWRF